MNISSIQACKFARYYANQLTPTKPVEITEEEMVEYIESFEMMNPRLISDGHGEYSDVYRMDHDDAVELSAIILTKLKQT